MSAFARIAAATVALGLLMAGPGGTPARAQAPDPVEEDSGYVDLLEGAPPTPQQPTSPTTPLAEPGRREVVARVRVDGNRRIEADAIKAVLSTTEGELLRAHQVAEDIRRIYELGFFRDVQVQSEPGPQGTIVTFVVEENPVIRRVSVSGNDNLDGDDIKDKLTLTVGSTIDYPLLIENQERIEALYQTKGYYLAKVRYEIEALVEGVVGVNFAVDEGDKLRLRKIHWTGNDSIPDGDLEDVIQTKEWGWLSFVTRFWDHSGLYAEPIFLGDLDRVSRLYMDRGFIRVAIGQPEVDVEERGLDVHVEIVEGPQFRVGRIDVFGDEAMDRDELLKRVQLSPDDVFNRSMLTDDVERLRGYYEDRGFFDASVSPRTQVNPEALTIDVTFEAEKGGLYFVDAIDIHGNTRTRDPIIRRELRLAEGELYSRYHVRRSQRRVRRLGFFEEVEIEPRRLSQDGRVALDVDIVERPTGSFSFGAGFGSTDGFVVTALLRQDNLFGSGRGVNASVDLGSRNSRVFLNWTEPYFMGTAATLSTTLSRLEREFIDFDEEISGLSGVLEYPLDEGDTVAGTGYTFSSREVVSIDSFRASSLLQREEFQGDSTTSQMTLSLRRDTRDDIRFPTQGQVSGLAIEFAGLGGINKFLRLEGRTTHWLPLKRWLPFESTFVVNSRVGWAVPFNSIDDFDLPDCTATRPGPALESCLEFTTRSPEIEALLNIDDDLELPLTERYFLGGLGAFQVRGFKQRSLGPRRSILDQQIFVLPDGSREVAFFPDGFSLTAPSGCILAECNSLFDTDVSDFEDLDQTDVIGGNKMFLLNLELQFPISDELGLRGIFFLDMGNAFGEDEGINVGDLRYGTGGGVQWFSPFGPITIILGIPLDKLEDEDATVFEFSMGGSSF